MPVGIRNAGSSKRWTAAPRPWIHGAGFLTNGLRGKAAALCLAALGSAYSQEGEAPREIAHYGAAWERLALSLACDVLA